MIPGLEQCLAIIIPEANSIGVASAIWNSVQLAGLANCMMMDEDKKKSAAEDSTRLGSRLLRENKLLIVAMTKKALLERRMVFHDAFRHGLINPKHKSYNMVRMLDTRNYVMLELRTYMAVRPQISTMQIRSNKKAGVYYTGKEAGVRTDDFVDMVGLNLFMESVFFGNAVKYGSHW